MRTRVLVFVAAVCLAAACSDSSGKKPAAAPSVSTTAVAQGQTASPAPSPTSSSSAPDATVALMCSNLDASIKDLADLADKIGSGQSVPQFGIGLPIVTASDAARKLVLDHPGASINPGLTAFAQALDDLDAKATAPKPDSDAIGWSLTGAVQAWKALSLDCGNLGGYAFSNRLR